MANEGRKKGKAKMSFTSEPYHAGLTAHRRKTVQAWLPDGYNRIFRIVCVWPFGLLDYGSATLRCKI